jgi:uncharacterized glyoxalase superfamily protein PhnB
MTDPFDSLARPLEPQTPRPRFARQLRARLVAALGLDEPAAFPTIELPDRRDAMSTSTHLPTTAPAISAVTPCLVVSDPAAALEWYAAAFGAASAGQAVGADGRGEHVELAVGKARLTLTGELPGSDVRAPASLGGTAVTLEVTVADVDGLYARAVAAGATGLAEPADQRDGSRRATLADPFGHRWILSQPAASADASARSGRASGGTQERPRNGGGIWAAVYYHDALAGIRFLVEVFGFEEQLVVTGPDGRSVVHSQLRWPEGGVVQVGTYDPDNVYSLRPGEQSLYVITADPDSVWQRCVGVGLEVIRPPAAAAYDPGGTVFSVRDREGNIWSFGTYAGESG